MKIKLTFLINHCYSQLYFSGVCLTLSASRYLIMTFKYAKYLNNMRTNKWCDCFSTTLFSFSLVGVEGSWRHLLLSVQSKQSKSHCCWLCWWTGFLIFKNKITYFCIFFQYKNKGEEMYSTSIVMQWQTEDRCHRVLKLSYPGLKLCLVIP